MRSLARTSVISLLLGWAAVGNLIGARAQVLQPDQNSKPHCCAALLESGQLTVKADRCSLREVVDAIRVATGAKVEWTGQGVDDPGTVLSGPGSPADIISGVLYGSPWNFIIISAPDGSLSEVQLSRRPPLPVAPVLAVAASPTPRTPATEQRPADAATKNGTASAQVVQPLPAVVNKSSSKEGSMQAGTGTAVYTPSMGNVANGPLKLPYGSPATPSSGTPAAPNMVASKPVLPSNIPPEIWNVYPPNLMQLVSSPKPPPPPPPAPAIPPGQVVLINQILPNPP